MERKATSGPLLYGPDDVPPFWTTLFLAVQHVVLNIGSMMLTPIIIGAACGLSVADTEYMIFATLLVSSVATLVQVKRIGKVGSGYLVILGPSGAFLACSISAVSMGGLPLLGSMTLLSAPLEAAVAYLFGFFRKVFTPALGGTVVMLVGMLVVPITVGMWTGGPEDPLYCSPEYFLTGLVPVSILLGSLLSDRRWVCLWSSVMGLGFGVAAALCFGMADFSGVGSQPLLALPERGWPGLELRLGLEHLPLFLTFLVATLISTIETFGDTVALQNVSEGKLKKIDYDRVQGGMYADTVGSMLAGAAASVADTTYSTVMPVIKLTRVSSRVVGYTAAGLLGVIAFMPRVAHLFMSIPDPVMGGLGTAFMIILFGEGFKIAAAAELNTENGMVVGTGLSMGLLASVGQFFPELFPESLRFLSRDVLTMGGVSALLVNLLFVYRVRKTESLSLPARIDALPDLHGKIEAFQDRFRLTPERRYALQLASEEVFAYFCDQNPDELELSFRWKYHSDYILTEITGKGALSDMDAEVDPESLRGLDENALRELGLFLLAKVANRVEHAHISGRHYVQFRV